MAGSGSFLMLADSELSPRRPGTPIVVVVGGRGVEPLVHGTVSREHLIA